MAGYEPVRDFWGDYRFLSNFAHVVVQLDGVTYPSVEHAYQAAKTHDAATRRRIAACDTPGQAKKLADTVEKRADWNAELRVAAMRDLLAQKFTQEPYRGLLVGTAGQLLVEENTWDDTFFGVCKGRGTNHLGNLLMTVRGDLLGLARPVLVHPELPERLNAAVSDFVAWASTRFEALHDYPDGLESPRVVLLSSDALDVTPELWDRWIPVESWNPLDADTAERDLLRAREAIDELLLTDERLLRASI